MSQSSLSSRSSHCARSDWPSLIRAPTAFQYEKSAWAISRSCGPESGFQIIVASNPFGRPAAASSCLALAGSYAYGRCGA